MLADTTPQRPNSQSTINKLLEKDLKELIFTLDSSELHTLFRNLQIQTKTTSSKEFTKIGVKCVECHTIFDTFQSKGYGKDQQEALVNSIKIILENMISTNYRIESVKKALKYCNKFKGPVINTSSQSNSLLSSTKKSMKKVEGFQNSKMPKKLLDYDYPQESANKQNMSKRINETSMELKTPSIEDKLSFTTQDIRLGNDQLSKAIEARPSSPIEESIAEKSTENGQKKCGLTENGKDCIYLEMLKHSEREMKSMRARIRLLEEENSIMKELLLKDFNKDQFKKSKMEEVLRP